MLSDRFFVPGDAQVLPPRLDHLRVIGPWQIDPVKFDVGPERLHSESGDDPEEKSRRERETLVAIQKRQSEVGF